jgi:hypothetical protein
MRTGIAVLAFAFPIVGARADDSAPPAPPPDEGIVQSLSRKVEKFSVTKNPVVHSLATKAGIATDPGAPADFVIKTRPAGEEEFIPVGRVETEHSIKVKTPAELKAMQADFDAVKARHDAIRATFPPAMKAVADAEAARAAKAAKPKKTPPAAVPASPQ